jgi:hypothetical protein
VIFVRGSTWTSAEGIGVAPGKDTTGFTPLLEFARLEEREMHEMFIVVVLAAGATLTVCALTIGAWRGMNSTTAVVMALAFLAGAGIAMGGDATVFYIGFGAAFLVYFCFMLANIATTLKEIAIRLDGKN